MMVNTPYLLLVLLLLVGLGGCSDHNGPAGQSKSYLELSDSSVLMKVGGKELRKIDLETWVKCRIAIAKSVQKELKNISNDTLAARMYVPTFRQFSSKALYLAAAEKAGIKPSEDDMAAVWSDVILSYGNGIVKSKDGFRKRLSPEQFAVLERKVADDALIFAYWKSLAPDAFVVTDEEFAAIRKRADDLNARAEKTLKEQQAKAKDICAKLRAGEDFTKLAEAESATANEDSGGFWGEFAPNEIPYPEVAEKVSTMKAGEISDPIELDDGIHIVKVVERKGSKNVSVFNPEEESVSLSRIVVRLPMMYAVGSTNEIRRDMRNQKLEPLQKDWLGKLRAETKVEYPSGTNLWSFLKRKRGNAKKSAP